MSLLARRWRESWRWASGFWANQGGACPPLGPSPQLRASSVACDQVSVCCAQLDNSVNWGQASLVVQWLGIRLPMQGTQVRALVWEDPTCRGATEPVRHNYWACALEPASHNYWARVPQLLKPTCLEPVLHNKRSHRNEKPVHLNEDPMQSKN